MKRENGEKGEVGKNRQREAREWRKVGDGMEEGENRAREGGKEGSKDGRVVHGLIMAIS